MKTGRVKHIAFTLYPVKDMARARKFYEGALGLKKTKDFRGRWVEYHLVNGAFAISTMVPHLPASASVAFEVDDVDAALKRLKTKRVKVKVPPFESPVCRMAVVLDPDGNALTLHAKKRA